jgi:hypothetical protein
MRTDVAINTPERAPVRRSSKLAQRLTRPNVLPHGCEAGVHAVAVGRARPASFACELGREADFQPMTRMENVNPLFFSEISLKLV